MHMIMSFFKGTFQFLLAIWVIEVFGKFFLRRTLVGRTILLIIKDIWLFLKLGSRMIRHIGKLAYTDTKKLNNYMYKHYKRFEDKKPEKKKVVNGNDNVINFKEAKKKHNK